MLHAPAKIKFFLPQPKIGKEFCSYTSAIALPVLSMRQHKES
jgi:hypothetical protein